LLRRSKGPPLNQEEPSMAWQRSRTATSFLWALVLLALALGPARAAFAASIAYGD
jgi:hypothetical protein